MAWPLSQDYNEAIQNPASSFGDAELRIGEAATNALGMPMPRSGNFADVYEVTCQDGGHWAVKCFTREMPGLRERYAQISAFLAQTQLPFMVDFQFLPQGVRVRGQWYPILKMQWVEGLLLNHFVRDHLAKPNVLEGLSKVWVRLAKALREAGFAHADLQHGNIILVPGSRAGALAVKLIDYDGMFVPALASVKSGEVGHPSFQHPQRAQENYYGPEVDRLPLLAVACALRAVAFAGRDLWDRYDNGDNLLFREVDLKNPGESRLFRELWTLPDQATHDLTGYLVMALGGELIQAPWLDQLMSGDKPQPLNQQQEDWVNAWLGPATAPVPAVPRGHESAPAVAHLPPAVTMPIVPGALAQPAPAAVRVGQLVSSSPPPVVNPFAAMQIETQALRSATRSKRPLILAAALGGVLLVLVAVILIIALPRGEPAPAFRIKSFPASFAVQVGENLFPIVVDRQNYQGTLTVHLKGLPDHITPFDADLTGKQNTVDVKIVVDEEAQYVKRHEIQIVVEGKQPGPNGKQMQVTARAFMDFVQ